MKCSKCGCEDSQIINEVKMTGKDFSASKGCCGFILQVRLGFCVELVEKESRRKIHNIGCVIIVVVSGEPNEKSR